MVRSKVVGFLAPLVLLFALPAPPQGQGTQAALEEERAALLAEERLGDLGIGLSQAEVLKRVPCPVQRGKEVLEAATGDFVQDWRFPTCGLQLKMGSEKKGGAKSVLAITVTAPSTLRTKHGIGIGSSEAEVIRAYGRLADEEWTRKGETFVAGSVYGGILFTFTGGKVTKILLGAAAE